MAIPFLNHLDLRSVSQLQNALLHKTTSASATGVAAKIIYDTGTNTIKYHNGTDWVELVGDKYVTGGSLIGTDLVLTRNGGLADITIDLSALDEIVNDSTITITGGTLLTAATPNTFTLNQSGNTEITINHDSVTRTNTTDTAATLTNGGSFTIINSVTSSTEGHVTGVSTKTYTLPTITDVDVTVANLRTRLGQISDDTTIGDATDVDITFAGGVIVTGDLTVNGTTTTVNTETINLADNIITLNSNYTGSTPTENGGIEIERGTLPNVALRWNETDDKWEITSNGTNYYEIGTVGGTTYKTSVGNGTLTSITVTHNLNTKDVMVQLYDVSSFETVYADVVRDTVNTVVLTFASAPATNDVRVLISKI